MSHTPRRTTRMWASLIFILGLLISGISLYTSHQFQVSASSPKVQLQVLSSLLYRA